MEYAEAYLRETLPAEEPSSELVPDELNDEIGSWIERIDADRGLVAHSARWTYAMFSELGRGQFRLSRGYFRGWHDFPVRWFGFPEELGKRASIGLFDRETEEFGFGLVIDVPPFPGPQFEIIDHIEFPRLKASFSLAYRQVAIEPHAIPHPANATSACWARCNTTGMWGAVTAGHALSGNRPGRPVPLAGGGVGYLLRSYYQPIDAAFVVASKPPVAPAPLPILSFPACGLPVMLECQSGCQPRTVVRVMDSMGVLHTREFAVLLFLDQPGVHGDSGALVRTTNGEAVGIYKAGMPSPQSPRSNVGAAQNFEQAVFALDVTAFL